MASSAIHFSSPNKMLEYFEIPDVRYHTFQRYYTVRLLNSGCLRTGDKLFDVSHPSNIALRHLFDKDNVRIDHYFLKGFFYRTADLAMSYTPDFTRRGENKKNIKFRVGIRGSSIGGSLNYEDLHLNSDASVAEFCKGFGGLEAKQPYTKAVEFIADTLARLHREHIRHALAREIIEECTVTGSSAAHVDDIVRTLRYTGFHVNERSSWQTIVTFEFDVTGVDAYRKVREMDEFCCQFRSIGERNIYCIYGDDKGRGKRYTMDLPYTLSSHRDDKTPSASARKPLVLLPRTAPTPTPTVIPTTTQRSLIFESRGTPSMKPQPLKRSLLTVTPTRTPTKTPAITRKINRRNTLHPIKPAIERMNNNSSVTRRNRNNTLLYESLNSDILKNQNRYNTHLRDIEFMPTLYPAHLSDENINALNIIAEPANVSTVKTDMPKPPRINVYLKRGPGGKHTLRRGGGRRNRITRRNTKRNSK